MTEKTKVSNPAGPSAATIKRLFARSGNRCAFLKCRSPLVDGKKVIGKICHIKAQNEGGPRYDPNQTAEERQSYENLILMCGRHHDVIDDDEDAYTVEHLHRLKAMHEQTATELSEDQVERDASLLLLDQSVLSTNQSGGITAHTINIHNYQPSDAKASDQQSAGFIAVQPKDGDARFRAPDQPLGMFFNTLPFAESPDIEIFLAEGAAMWLRLLPREDIAREWSHDELLTCGRGPGVTLQPMFWNNLQYLRAEDGIGAYATVDNLRRETKTESVMFAFSTGEIWSVDTALLKITGQKHLQFLNIARTFVQRLRGYGEFLQCLGIQPPFNWIAGLDGVKGWRLKVPPPPNHVSTSPGETCLSSVVVATGSYDLKQHAAIVLRPFFNQLFRKCGMMMPQHIEEVIRTARN